MLLLPHLSRDDGSVKEEAPPRLTGKNECGRPSRQHNFDDLYERIQSRIERETMFAFFPDRLMVEALRSYSCCFIQVESFQGVFESHLASLAALPGEALPTRACRGAIAGNT